MEYTCASSTPEVLFTYKEIPDCFRLCGSEPLAHCDLQLQNKHPSLCDGVPDNVSL